MCKKAVESSLIYMVERTSAQDDTKGKTQFSVAAKPVHTQMVDLPAQGLSKENLPTAPAAPALTLAGTTTVTVDDPLDAVWTASGGSIIARHAVIAETGGDVLCYCLLEAVGPADVTATTGNTLTVALSASGIFTLA